MSTAFAKCERERGGLDETVDIVTGGTDPAESLHDEVITAEQEEGFDLQDVTPRRITPEELQTCDYVAAMGCTADGVCPATWSEESRAGTSKIHTGWTWRRFERSAIRSNSVTVTCSTRRWRRRTIS